jgi:hypothetical protein
MLSELHYQLLIPHPPTSPLYGVISVTAVLSAEQWTKSVIAIQQQFHSLYNAQCHDKKKDSEHSAALGSEHTNNEIISVWQP